jgi:hypothetical protein
MERVRAFLGIEALAFYVASFVHSGLLLRGYQHAQAMIAEGVIGTVLALGLAVSALDGRATRVTGLAVQSFALIGTLVGIFTMVIGVGPRSGLDVMLHTVFLVLLVAGLAYAAIEGRAIADIGSMRP